MEIDKDTMLGNLYQQWEEVSRENALKLEQILDLEDILYATRVIDALDGSPCWCCLEIIEKVDGHAEYCERARKATKHLWSIKP